MAVRGLKTKIAFNVALLLLISALVTDVLVILVVQSTWVRRHIEEQKSFYHDLAECLLSPPMSKHPEVALDEKQNILSRMLNRPEPTPLLIVNQQGDIRYLSHSRAFGQALLKSAAQACLKRGQVYQQYLNHGWAVFWWHPHEVLHAVPLIKEDKLVGAVAAVISLRPIYASISQYNKPIFLYILINSAILTVAGLYRIFRIYLRPIDRIVAQADQYREDEDLLFSFRQEDNELNRLSVALNRMLKRISSDKNKLKGHVFALEKANRELKQAQNEIIRAEKMAGVGRLAAGIAHEIGNPIGIVLGYLDLLKNEDLNPDERADFLARTEKETQRMHTVISQLLDLARPKDAEYCAVSVHGIIGDIANVMRLQPIMQKTRIELQLDAFQDKVWANEEQLRQVLLNLFINAADAIVSSGHRQNGNILIHTDTLKPVDPSTAATLSIQVVDNGEGIAPEEIENIFDPFYTTKEPGQGTGLGLAVSFMIIEKMGGMITAQSELGQGTTITIKLPLTMSPTVD